MATSVQKTPPQPIQRPGLIISAIGLIQRIIGLLIASLLFSIVIEWAGLLFFWGDQGWRHSEAMLTNELRWLSEQGHQATQAQVRICLGAPLRVLGYIGEQQDSARRDLLESFVSLSQTPTRAASVCSQLAQESQIRLHWLQLFLCDALKTQAGCGHHQLAMPDLAALSEQLAQLHSSERLLEAEQQLVVLKAACQPGQLSNPTIHLMNWLNRWL